MFIWHVILCWIFTKFPPAKFKATWNKSWNIKGWYGRGRYELNQTWVLFLLQTFIFDLPLPLTWKSCEPLFLTFYIHTYTYLFKSLFTCITHFRQFLYLIWLLLFFLAAVGRSCVFASVSFKFTSTLVELFFQ